HFQRGMVFESQGKGVSAIEEYGKELLDRPQHLQSMIHLVRLLRNLGLKKETDEVTNLGRMSLHGHPKALALLAHPPEESSSPAQKGESTGEGALSAARMFLDAYARRIRSRKVAVGWTEEVRSALDRDEPEDALRLLTA